MCISLSLYIYIYIYIYIYRFLGLISGPPLALAGSIAIWLRTNGVIYIYICVCICICMYIYTYLYIYIYIYIYIYTHSYHANSYCAKGTNGVNTNGAAAKVMNLDRLGKRYALALLGISISHHY